MNDHDPIITLNVGGTLFTTYTSTLTTALEPGSLFSKMFTTDQDYSYKFQLPRKDGQGNVFLDRDPKSFQVILNYLRSGVVDEVEVVRLGKARLVGETQFFRLSNLESLLANMHSKVDKDRNQDLFADACGVMRTGVEGDGAGTRILCSEMALPSPYFQTEDLALSDIPTIFELFSRRTELITRFEMNSSDISASYRLICTDHSKHPGNYFGHLYYKKLNPRRKSG
ncbi:hypothetical protein HDU93_009776 [Gonapodya sp. JEL0774]|nr:hypothetical protein HDU93_009776 [Gonapodya sp. JEL0774]